MNDAPAAVTLGLWGGSAAAPVLRALAAAIEPAPTWVCGSGPWREEWPDCTVHVAGDRTAMAELVAAAAATDPGASLLLVYCDDTAAAVLDLGEHAHVRSIRWPTRFGELAQAVLGSAARRSELATLRRERERLDAVLRTLSERERQVLELLRRGAPSKAVARAMHLSKRTVDDHRRSMLAKTGHDSIVALLGDLSHRELLRERWDRLTAQRWRPGVRPSGGDGPSLPGDERTDPLATAGLRRFGCTLVDLEDTPEPACVVDRDLRIAWVNAGWIERGGGSAFLRRWGIGRTIVEAFHGPLRHFYMERLARCQVRQQPWYHRYECPTSAEARTFLLTVSPGPDGMLLMRHTCVGTRAHGSRVDREPAPETRYRDWRGAVRQCGNCRRVARPGASGWALVPAWIDTIPERVEQTLCPDCVTELFAAEPSA